MREHRTAAGMAATGQPAAAPGSRAAQEPAPIRTATWSLERQVGSGVIWVLLAFGAFKALGFVSNLILARLLTPADFGLVSFAMIVIGAFTLLQDLGVPAAIIYGERDVREVGGTALTINLAVAGLLLAVAAAASPWLAALGGDAAIGPILTVLALGLVFSALSSVQNALLIRELALRRKFLPDVVPVLVSSLTSIVLALVGFGAWSLVLGYLARTIATTGLLWYLTPVRPWPRLQWTYVRELLGYGQHISLAAIIGFIVMNVDYFIVGTFLGATELGIYTVAFVIATLPAKAISEVAAKVAFPALARLKDDAPAMLRTFMMIMSAICVAALPVALGIFIAAPAYVPVVLNPKWVGIIPPLQVLVALGLLQAIGYTFPAAYKALGHPDMLWKFNLAKLLLLLPAMLYMVRFGIVGISIVHVVSEIIILPAYAVVLSRYLQIPPRRLGQAIAPVLASGLLAAVVIVGVYLPPPLARLREDLLGSSLLAVLVLAVYAVSLVLFYRRLVGQGRAVVTAWLRRQRLPAG